MSDTTNERVGMNDGALSSLDDVVASLSNERVSDGNDTSNTNQFQIPDKFQGKSTEEIIKSYMELEAQQGRQGAEFGALRKLADTFITQPVNPSHGTTNEPAKVVDINWDDLPEQEKLRVVVDQEIAPFRNEVLALRKDRMEANLKTAHPDYVDIVRNQDFQKWVVGSEIRKEMFVRSDKQYDFDAANELFNTWKAVSGAKAQAAEAERGQAYRDGGMVTNSVTDASPAKIYRRADLINLKIRNPQAYARLAPEIDRAYAEGRVR